MSKNNYIRFSDVEVGKSYHVVNGNWDFCVEYKESGQVLISFYSHLGYHTSVYPLNYCRFKLIPQ